MRWLGGYRNRRAGRAAQRALRLVNAQLAERAADVLVFDSALVLRVLRVKGK